MEDGERQRATHLRCKTRLAARVRIDARLDERLAGVPVVKLRVGKEGFVRRDGEAVRVGRAEEERRAEEADKVVLLQ